MTSKSILLAGIATSGILAIATSGVAYASDAFSLKPVLNETFDQELTRGWGDSWSKTYGNISADNGQAVMTLKPGTLYMTYNNIGDDEYDATNLSFDMNLPKLSTVGTSYVRGQIMRNAGENTFYAVAVSTDGNKTYFQIERINKSKTEVLVRERLDGIRAGESVKLSLNAEIGERDEFVQLDAKIVRENETKEISFKDESDRRILRGKSIAVSGYQSRESSETTVLRVDNLQAGKKLHKQVLPEWTGGDIDRNPADIQFWGNPVVEDDFNGDTLDSSLWNNQDTWVSYDWSDIKKDNVRVENGNLVMSAKKLDAPVIKRSDPLQKERWYSSSYINSIGNFSQEYGRWEMRAKMPVQPETSAGLWSGFWLRTDEKTLQGEVDIAEGYGTVGDNADPKAIAYVEKNGSISDKTEGTVHYSQAGTHKRASWIPRTTESLREEYHIWAVEKTPAGITFYFDNKPYHFVSSEDCVTNSGTKTTMCYKDAFPEGAKLHMRMIFQVGNKYWGLPNANTETNPELTVDYIRAWEYKG